MADSTTAPPSSWMGASVWPRISQPSSNEATGSMFITGAFSAMFRRGRLTNSTLNTSLSGLKDSIGAVTGISLLVTNNFHTTTSLNNGSTTVAGAAATAGFTATMARDYFLLNTSPLTPGGETNSEASIRFAGLVAGQSYLLTVFSSRADPVGPRRLNVTLAGVAEMSGFIDGTNNNSNVLELTAAATTGEIGRAHV